MKRLRTILLLFGILCAGGIILLLTPRLWQDKIEIVLNENFLIAINNAEISVLNGKDSIISSGDIISIISVSHGG